MALRQEAPFWPAVRGTKGPAVLEAGSRPSELVQGRPESRASAQPNRPCGAVGRGRPMRPVVSMCSALPAAPWTLRLDPAVTCLP